MLKLKDIIKDFKIDEVAQSASNMCRFRGRYKWVSVAEHLCLVHDILSVKYKGLSKYRYCEFSRLGLIHDLCECMAFSDIVSPYKPYVLVDHDYKISTLSNFEDELTKLVYIKLWGSLPTGYNECKISVKRADIVALEIEKKYHGLDYCKYTIGNIPGKIKGWPPKKAKAQFLKRINLYGEIN